jgi:hypothetical protein
MESYTLEELKAAHKALSSSVHKIEKVRETLLGKQPPPRIDGYGDNGKLKSI